MYNTTLYENNKTVNDDEISIIVDIIINDYHKLCEEGSCDVGVGEYLNSIEIHGYSMEVISRIWAICMSIEEGDTIVQFFNNRPDLSLLDKDSSYNILGGN